MTVKFGEYKKKWPFWIWIWYKFEI